MYVLSFVHVYRRTLIRHDLILEKHNELIFFLANCTEDMDQYFIFTNRCIVKNYLIVNLFNEDVHNFFLDVIFQ